MAKKHPKLRVKRAVKSEPVVALRKALAKLSQDDLVEIVIELVERDGATKRDLLTRFQVALSTRGLFEETQLAIADATDFDERQINYNFDYDYAAYETIQRNFNRLVIERRFDEAMQLSLELMRDGSYQVEMSDEGLMTNDIAECLKVVIAALKKSDVPPPRIVEWCIAMEKSDRVGFICNEDLKSLQKKFTK